VSFLHKNSVIFLTPLQKSKFKATISYCRGVDLLNCLFCNTSNLRPQSNILRKFSISLSVFTFYAKIAINCYNFAYVFYQHSKSLLLLYDNIIFAFWQGIFCIKTNKFAISNNMLTLCKDFTCFACVYVMLSEVKRSRNQLCTNSLHLKGNVC